MGLCHQGGAQPGCLLFEVLLRQGTRGRKGQNCELSVTAHGSRPSQQANGRIHDETETEMTEQPGLPVCFDALLMARRGTRACQITEKALG